MVLYDVMLMGCRGYLADVGVVWVVFWRHKQQHHALGELDAVEGHDAHVEEDPKQDGQGDLPQQLPDHNGQSWGGDTEKSTHASGGHFLLYKVKVLP